MLIRIAIATTTALLVSLLITPVLRRLALRLNITDRPDAALKPHARPTAYLGGVGIYLGWAAGLAAVQIAWPEAVGWWNVWVVVVLAGGILATGLADDIRNISPWPRLLAEVAAAVLLFAGGVRFAAVPLLATDSWPGTACALAVQIAMVIGACNSANLLDGLDGLCGGVMTAVMAGLAALAAGAVYLSAGRFAPAPEASGGLRQVMLLAPPLAGALLGFLRYNYRPASIFMGDAGSLMLGFVVAACLALLGSAEGPTGLKLTLSGLVLFAVPIGDAGLAFVRRAINRRPIFQGDRSHFYDQLVDRGFTVARTVNLCILLSLGFAALAWVGGVLIESLRWAAGLYAATAAAVALLIWRLGFVRVDRPKPPNG